MMEMSFSKEGGGAFMTKGKLVMGIDVKVTARLRLQWIKKKAIPRREWLLNG